MALAVFQQGNRNLPVAIKHIAHGRRLLDQVVDHFDTLFNRTANQDRQTLTVMRVNCVDGFNQLAGSISNSSLDTTQSLRDQSDALSSGIGPIELLRRGFEGARERRRDALRLYADIDAAESHLKDALSQLEAFNFLARSFQVDLMQVVILQHLGEFERARRLVPLTIPQIFGGRSGNLPFIGELAPF